MVCLYLQMHILTWFVFVRFVVKEIVTSLCIISDNSFVVGHEITNKNQFYFAFIGVNVLIE